MSAEKMIRSLFHTSWSFQRKIPKILTLWTITLLRHPKLNFDIHTDLHGLKFNKKSGLLYPMLMFKDKSQMRERERENYVTTIYNTNVKGWGDELTMNFNLYMYN